jgi:hypothetical protein
MAVLRLTREITEKKIFKVCGKQFLSLGDLAKILTMNKNTL